MKNVNNLPVGHLHTCAGKGGEYEYLGTGRPAGLLKNFLSGEYEIYRDVKTEQVWMRGYEDFLNRMEAINLAAPDLVAKAAIFARAAHEAVKQVRKYSEAPYFVHPQRVALMLTMQGCDREVIAAGYLHDVVEDTGVTIETIEELFGERVARIVNGVTNVAYRTEGGPNRAERFRLNLEHLKKQDADAKTVRLADSFDNLTDVHLRDPKFAAVFVEEKAQVIDACAGSHFELHRLASQNVAEVRKYLKGLK